MEYRIEHYLTPCGQKDLYIEWLKRLRDRQAKVAIIRRIARIELGNFGDHKFCRNGVWELRIDAGPGYRVYYAHSEKRVILLLCAGTKRTQQLDIGQAVFYWTEWLSRGEDEK